MGLLETLAAQRGGLFVSNGNAALEQNLSSVINLFLNFVEGINSDYTPQGAKGIKARAGFYCDEAFSACSMASEDEDAFCVSIGAYAKLQWFFTQAIKNDLLDLTNLKDLKRNSVSVTEYSLSDEINGLSEFSSRPNNKGQKVTDFSQMGCLLLLQHELAHLWNGHAGLKAARARGEVSNDIWPEANNGIDRISHLLELDADAKASYATLIMSCPGALVCKGRRIVYYSRITDNDMFERRLFDNIIYTYIVFRFTHYLSNLKNPFFPGKSHPPSLSRVWWHLDILRHQTCLHGNLPFDQFDSICETALFVAEQAFQLINGTHDELLSFRESREFARVNKNNLLTMWPKLSDTLEKYRRGTSLPRLFKIESTIVPPLILPSIIGDHSQATSESYHINNSSISPNESVKPQSTVEESCPLFFGKHAGDLKDISTIICFADRHIDRVKHACRSWPFEGPLTKLERRRLDQIRKIANAMHQSLGAILLAKEHHETLAPWDNFLRKFYKISQYLISLKSKNSPYATLLFLTISFDDVLNYVDRCATFISGKEKGSVNDIICCDYTYFSYESQTKILDRKIFVSPMSTYALPVPSEARPVFPPRRIAGVPINQDKARIANLGAITMSFVDAIISGFEQLDA